MKRLSGAVLPLVQTVLSLLYLQFQTRLDSVENEGDGEERAELGDSIGDGGPLGERVADDVAQGHDDDGFHDCYNKRNGCHHHYTECCRFWIACSQLIAHSHTVM